MPATLAAAMTADPHTLPADAPLVEAIRLLESLDLHHLPLTREGEVVGLLRAADVARHRLPGLRLVDDEELTAGDVATGRFLAALPSDPLPAVLEAMVERRVDVVLAFEAGELAGIFTSWDACRLLAQALAEGD